MKLVHTLLFLLRENRLAEDLAMTGACLKSLEKATYKTVVVYNQGFFTEDMLKRYLEAFNLDFHIIGDGANVGTSVGRQRCFEYIWDTFPDTEYISEVHPDMYLSSNWEDPLINYLETHDEPVISSGIIDINGNMPFIGKTAALPASIDEYDDFLNSIRENSIIHGFTNPCIHVSKILKETGGYNPTFLKGKQCFEDDSLLLGYYYYYGTRLKWRPKINYNSIAYHAIAGQRIGIGDNIMINYNGLVMQYGAMGLLHLSELHKSQWHKNYFWNNYNILINTL